MTRLLRIALAGLLLLLAVGLALSWPVRPTSITQPALALASLALAASLWRAPSLLFVLLPGLALLIDASPWTGWLLTGEQDVAVLAMLAGLLLRGPIPALALSRRTILVLAAMSAMTVIGALLGILVPAPPGGSDLVYLSPLGSLRAAKPWVEVMALLPWITDGLRRRQGGRALTLGLMLLGAGVAASAALERAAFAHVFDMASDYRVTGTFNSMHVGGGHIGAAMALVLPFAVAAFGLRLRMMAVLLLLPILYALAVTFARAAYAAGFAAVLMMALVVIWQGRRRPHRVVLPGLLALGLAGLVVVAALDLPFMAARLAVARDDLAFRAENWRHSLELHGPSPLTWALGAGLGTYPRLSAAASPATDGPSWYVVNQTLPGLDAPGLTLVSRLPFFLGHRVPLSAIGQSLDLSFAWRAHAVQQEAQPPVTTLGGVTALVCEKLLLYSFDCAQTTAPPSQPDAWQNVHVRLNKVGDPAHTPSRPLELSFATAPGAVIDIAHVSLSGPDGRNLLQNGDFSEGTTAWFPTDDHHWIWRTFDQFLTMLFETGVIGLLVWLWFLTEAFRGGLRAARGRDAMLGAALAGAVVAVAVNSLFDAVLEAPRLALVINLVLVSAVVAGDQKDNKPL